tara:strand:- start:2062 stop:2475 length:414 start_codon:yes stop_codon:yes gene_type:complete
MSDLVKTARALLVASSDVTAIVGSRVSALYREEGDALPSIVIEVDSVEPDLATGLSGVAKMIRGDLTITCFAETLSTCVDLAQKSAAALGGQRGSNADGKNYAVAASISTDSVEAALSGGSSGPVSLLVESEIYLDC